MRKSNLSKSINLKVLLLCGGQGTRLHPLTKTIPKPLVRIKNKTIIDYIIKHLKGYGLKNFLICSGYRAKMIENHAKILEYIRNTLAIKFDVEYSYEDKNNFDLCFDNGKLSSLLPSFHFI